MLNFIIKLTVGMSQNYDLEFIGFVYIYIWNKVSCRIFFISILIFVSAALPGPQTSLTLSVTMAIALAQLLWPWKARLRQRRPA